MDENDRLKSRGVKSGSVEDELEGSCCSQTFHTDDLCLASF